MTRNPKTVVSLTSQELRLIQQLHELTGKDENEIISTALYTWMETLKDIPQEFQAIHWGIDSW